MLAGRARLAQTEGVAVVGGRMVVLAGGARLAAVDVGGMLRRVGPAIMPEGADDVGTALPVGGAARSAAAFGTCAGRG